MTKNVQFIDELCEILGEQFFFMDRIDQDDLFEMQDNLAKLIASNATEGLGLANYMVEKFPNTFKVEKLQN